MKLINNTYKILYYYLEENQIANFLYFGEQLETSYTITSFDNANDWISYVDSQIKNHDWYTSDLQNPKIPETFSDIGYLTKYNFRLNVDDETEYKLDILAMSNNDNIELVSRSGDLYTLSKSDFLELLDQYKKDKLSYIKIVRGFI